MGDWSSHHKQSNSDLPATLTRYKAIVLLLTYSSACNASSSRCISAIRSSNTNIFQQRGLGSATVYGSPAWDVTDKATKSWIIPDL